MSAGGPRALPSIGTRLARTLLASALWWSLAVSAAVWLAVRHEMTEFMDDGLQGLAEVMAVPLQQAQAAPDGPPPAALPSDRFIWQVVQHRPDAPARVLLASPQSPPDPLQPTPTAGFADVPAWRLYGSALGSDGRMLYVAQSTDERVEVAVEVALNAAFATLAIVLLANLWLRARTSRELQPLQRLSERLAGHDLLAPGASLGLAERAELQPIHQAIDSLAAQLSRRVAHERAFTAHAAHALRTPLAGMDAQLAVALRECTPQMRPRLQQVRTAAGRLQRVVAALLALFRSGVELQRQPQDLALTVARLPVPGLDVQVAPDSVPLDADADLLSAALLNLLDNALRHGAHQVRLRSRDAWTLQVHDDGPGVSAERRLALRQALQAQAYEGQMGLGLMLADMVARAHGGALSLPDAGPGFVVELTLGPAPAARHQEPPSR